MIASASAQPDRSQRGERDTFQGHGHMNRSMPQRPHMRPYMHMRQQNKECETTSTVKADRHRSMLQRPIRAHTRRTHISKHAPALMQRPHMRMRQHGQRSEGRFSAHTRPHTYRSMPQRPNTHVRGYISCSNKTSDKARRAKR